jgi:hypothetical protein
MPPVRRESARDDEIIRYLLGELPEDEAERLDEQSVVDDEFAERLRVVEDDLVDAYASGRLAGERVKRFEAFYLASPHRRDKAAFARRFLSAIDDDARVREQRMPAVRPAPASRWAGRWAMAAAAVLCLAVGALLLREGQLRDYVREANERAASADQRVAALTDQVAAQQKAAAAAEASLARAQAVESAGAIALVLPPQTRGVAAVPIVALGPDAAALGLALEIEGAPHASYQAALKDPAGNQIVWRSGPLAVEAARTPRIVTLALPARLLKSQHYVVDVFASGAGRSGDFAGSYAFEVVRR